MKTFTFTFVVVPSIIVVAMLIAEVIARYIVNKKEQNKDE